MSDVKSPVPSPITQSSEAAGVVVESDALQGFDEASPVFEHASQDEVRFSESVALMRNFNLIDNQAARQQLLALARRLAEAERD